ncbi:MAG TPA: hypothetical protein ENK11_03715 [Phycisphaerales bacterium]|nr:hypothetical protein [Phycisphaerales bacterium]
MKRNTRHKHALALGLALLAAASAPLAGCGKEAPPPPPKAPPPPPPPPPKPDRVTLSALMAGADSRVQFPQEKAPYDRSLAEAIIAFAGALASGDETAFGRVLDDDARGVLDGMVADGTWYESADRIEAVRVVYLEQSPDEDEDATSAEFAFAVQEPDGAYTLAWMATRTDGGWVMSPLFTADATRPRASDWDSDSFADFLTASGWAGGPGGPAGVSMDTSDFGPDDAVTFYFVQQTLKNMLGADFAKFQSQLDFAEVAKASGVDITREAVDELVKEGERLVKSGSKPQSFVVKVFAMQIKAMAPTLGKSWDDSVIVKAMADALGISIEEMQKIYDG